MEKEISLMAQRWYSFFLGKYAKMIFLFGIAIFLAYYFLIISSNTYTNNQAKGIAGAGADYTSAGKGNNDIIAGKEIAGASADNSGAVSNRGSIIK
jgi:hypothetical protein